MLVNTNTFFGGYDLLEDRPKELKIFIYIFKHFCFYKKYLKKLIVYFLHLYPSKLFNIPAKNFKIFFTYPAIAY